MTEREVLALEPGDLVAWELGRRDAVFCVVVTKASYVRPTDFHGGRASFVAFWSLYGVQQSAYDANRLQRVG